MKHEYNEYGEITNANYFDGKNCVGMSYNKGNAHGKRNKGNTYNKVLKDTNGRSWTGNNPVKIACFYSGADCKCCTVWTTDGTVIDYPRLPNVMKRYANIWHRVQNDYYHGNTYAYTDITYSPYFKADHYNSIDLDKSKGAIL